MWRCRLVIFIYYKSKCVLDINVRQTYLNEVINNALVYLRGIGKAPALCTYSTNNAGNSHNLRFYYKSTIYSRIALSSYIIMAYFSYETQADITYFHSQYRWPLVTRQLNYYPLICLKADYDV